MSTDITRGDYDGYEPGDLVLHKPSGCVGIYTWMLGNAMRVEFPCNQCVVKDKQPCASWAYEDCIPMKQED